MSENSSNPNLIAQMQAALLAKRQACGIAADGRGEIYAAVESERARLLSLQNNLRSSEPEKTAAEVSGFDWAALKAHYTRNAPKAAPATTFEDAKTIRIFPTLAAFCIDNTNRVNGHDLSTPYRLYKLLQAIDLPGRGIVGLNTAVSELTAKGSSWYIYGKRQLKTVLKRGESIFWNRVKSNGRIVIRLVSRAKLTTRLGLDKLTGKEISAPVAMFLGSGRGRQSHVSAAIYAAWHAGRNTSDKKPKPITRRTLAHSAHISKFRQQSYEKKIGIDARRNVRILANYSDYDLDRARIHYHLPAYKHVDFLGKVDRHRRGAAYVAMLMPNSYTAPKQFNVIESRRQRTVNQTLDGLRLMSESATFNDVATEGSGKAEFIRVFHDNPVLAYKAASRDKDTNAFYRMQTGTRAGVWSTVQTWGIT